jgi:ATP-binding cassette subfamily B protein
LGQFLEPVAVLVTTGLQLQLLDSYMARINDVLDTPREQHGHDVRAAGILRGHITVESICFRDSPLGPRVISDVSLEILPGQKVAIVGRSGSGKSTVAHLLLGLYTPESGRVVFDGIDLSQLEAHSLRRQIGIVTQDAYLFGSSIRDNLVR